MTRRELRARAGRGAALLLVGLLLPACGIFGGEAPERVRDPAIVDFAERIDRFYRSLENVPLDVRATFESPALRAYFESDEEFAAYYASLASGARRALLRNATALRVAIDEFRFESDDVAVVDVRFVGRHTRTLRPGEVEIARTDTWKLRDGRWYVSPEKL